MRGSYMDEERLETQNLPTKGAPMTLGFPEQSAFDQ